MYYVYILLSDNHSAMYVGVTNDIQRRVYEHKQGLIDGFTKKYRVHKLVYYETTTDVTAAIAREKQIKKYSRRKKDELVHAFNPSRIDLYNEICQ